MDYRYIFQSQLFLFFTVICGFDDYPYSHISIYIWFIFNVSKNLEIRFAEDRGNLSILSREAIIYFPW